MTYEELLEDPWDTTAPLIGQTVEVACHLYEAIEDLGDDYQDLVNDYGSSAANALAICRFLEASVSAENAGHVDWYRVDTEDGRITYATLHRGDGGEVVADDLVEARPPDRSLILPYSVLVGDIDAIVNWTYVSWFAT